MARGQTGRIGEIWGPVEGVVAVWSVCAGILCTKLDVQTVVFRPYGPERLNFGLYGAKAVW